MPKPFEPILFTSVILTINGQYKIVDDLNTLEGIFKIKDMLEKQACHIPKLGTFDNLTCLGNIVLTFSDKDILNRIYLPKNITPAQYDWLEDNFNSFTNFQQLDYVRFVNEARQKLENEIPTYKKIIDYDLNELSVDKLSELNMIWNRHYFTVTRREFLGINKKDYIKFIELSYKSFIFYLTQTYLY